jgi:hypothetical protein
MGVGFSCINCFASFKHSTWHDVKSADLNANTFLPISIASGQDRFRILLTSHSRVFGPNHQLKSV